MEVLRKADDGKSSGALFCGIAGDSMQQVMLCSDWCASTGNTRIHHLTRKDPEEVTSSTGKRSAGKLACCVWKGGKSVSSYLSLHHDRVAVLPRARRVSGPCIYYGTSVSILRAS